MNKSGLFLAIFTLLSSLKATTSLPAQSHIRDAADAKQICAEVCKNNKGYTGNWVCPFAHTAKLECQCICNE